MIGKCASGSSFLWMHVEFASEDHGLLTVVDAGRTNRSAHLTFAYGRPVILLMT